MDEQELASAKTLLEQLAKRRIDKPDEDDALGRAFLEALKVAYQVDDVSDLQGKVTAALVTSTRLGDDTRYYYFGETPKMFPSASTIKTAIAARFLADLEQHGDTDDFAVGGRDYTANLNNMFGWSDNHSANVLQDRYGPDGMNNWLRSIGIAGSDIKFRSPWVSQGPVPGGGNSCSAEGLAQLYFLLAQDGDVPDFLTDASLTKLRGLLDSRGSVNTDPGHNDRLNALFPPSVHFLHKTGSNRRMLGDGGIVVDGERSYVLVLLDRTVTRKAVERFGLATLLMMRQYDREGWQDGDSPGLRYYTAPLDSGRQVLYASL
jgi:beta-lactamase class A